MSHRTFEGWASVEVVDKQGDLISMDAFKRVMKIWMKRGAPIIDIHSNKVVGRGLGYEFTKKEGKPGVRIKGEIHDDYSVDDAVWRKIKTGEYQGLSIGGKTLKEARECEGEKCWNGIKDLELVEISVVPSPANQEASIEAVNYLAKNNPGYIVMKRGLLDKVIAYFESMEKAGEHSPEFLRCLREVMENSPDVNEYAVCNASVGKCGAHRLKDASLGEEAKQRGGSNLAKNDTSPRGEEANKQEEEVAPGEEVNPLDEILARLDGIDSRLATLEEAKTAQEGEEEDKKPEEGKKPEEEDEEKSLKPGDIASIVEKAIERKFNELKTPVPSGGNGRPEVKKTDPAVSGAKDLDIMKIVRGVSKGPAGYRELDELAKKLTEA